MSLPCANTAAHEMHAQQLSMAVYAVAPQLALAGQPQPDDLLHLAVEGYSAIINVRGDMERALEEQRNAEAAGLRFFHLPLPVYELKAEHLATFHDLLHSQLGKTMVHCRSGTRVALLWMLERMVYAGWSAAQAEAHLRAAGYGDEAIEAVEFCVHDYADRTGLPMG